MARREFEEEGGEVNVLIKCPIKGGTCWGNECKFYNGGCKIEQTMEAVQQMSAMVMGYVERVERAKEAYQARDVEAPVKGKRR